MAKVEVSPSKPRSSSRLPDPETRFKENDEALSTYKSHHAKFYPWLDRLAVRGYLSRPPSPSSGSIQPVRVAWMKVSHKEATGRPIVWVVGLYETARKYAKAIYYIHHKLGRTVYIMDLRSQGESDSTLKDGANTIHVDRLEEYEEDLMFFLNSVVLKDPFFNAKTREGKKVVLLGHSTGGLIAARFALQHPEYVGKLLLTSPCFRPSFGFLIDSLPSILVCLIVNCIARIRGQHTLALPREKPFPVPGKGSLRQNSAQRSDAHNVLWEEIRAEDRIYRRGPTNGWVRSMLRSRLDADEIFCFRSSLLKRSASSFQTLVLHAGKDQIVCNHTIRNTAAALDWMCHEFPKAKHELLQEPAESFDDVFGYIAAFLCKK